jgi:chlorophyll synthase
MEPGATALARMRFGASFAAIAFLPLLSFASFGLDGVLLFAVCVFVIWAYSAPPLRLKSRPGLDLLTHALFVQTFAYLMCLLLIGARWTALDAMLLGVNFLASLSGQLSQQIRDFDLDVRTEANFSTRVGLEAAMVCRRAATGVLVALVIAGLIAGIVPLLLVPIALTFAPATLHRLGSPRPLGAGHAVVLPTAIALVYTGLLLCTQLLA